MLADTCASSSFPSCILSTGSPNVIRKVNHSISLPPDNSVMRQASSVPAFQVGILSQLKRQQKGKAGKKKCFFTKRFQQAKEVRENVCQREKVVFFLFFAKNLPSNVWIHLQVPDSSSNTSSCNSSTPSSPALFMTSCATPPSPAHPSPQVHVTQHEPQFTFPGKNTRRRVCKILSKQMEPDFFIILAKLGCSQFLFHRLASHSLNFKTVSSCRLF